MKTFRELCNNKPSVAIRAMVRGLIKQAKRDDFIINMHNFLCVKDGICFGCAATCAIQEIVGIDYDPKNLSDMYYVNGDMLLNQSGKDISQFECNMDCLRKGNAKPLLDYFEVNYIFPKNFLPFLGTYDWKENLEPYKIYAEQLEELGL